MNFCVNGVCALRTSDLLALLADNNEVDVSPGLWNVQTVELNGRITQLSVTHEDFHGNCPEEKLSKPMTVESAMVVVFEPCEMSCDSVKNQLENSPLQFVVLPNGVAAFCPNGTYDVFATRNSVGVINSIRIPFCESL